MDRNDAVQVIIVVVDAVALRKESVDRNCLGAKADSVSKWSLSARRAWIEIGGASQLIKSSIVALRKESVDRNYGSDLSYSDGVVSLSARRAWIEIAMTSQISVTTVVALRKESVDRNR